MNAQFASKLFRWKENGLHLFHVDIEHALSALDKFHHYLVLPTVKNVPTVEKL